MKKYLDNLQELKKLPTEVQKDIAEHLTNYDEVSVERSNGRYSCFNGSCLSSQYANDHKVWFFDKETVKQIPELAKIIKDGEDEYKRWTREEGKDFDWDKFGD